MSRDHFKELRKNPNDLYINCYSSLAIQNT